MRTITIKHHLAILYSNFFTGFCVFNKSARGSYSLALQNGIYFVHVFIRGGEVATNVGGFWLVSGWNGVNVAAKKIYESDSENELSCDIIEGRYNKVLA